MQLANAANLDRKSGVAQWRDLRFALMEKRNPETIHPRGIRLNPKVEPQVPPLRYASVGITRFRVVAHLGMGGGGWTESCTTTIDLILLARVLINASSKFRRPEDHCSDNLDSSDFQSSPSTSSHGTPGQAGQALQDSTLKLRSSRRGSDLFASRI
jgi:hypothetical protein